MSEWKPIESAPNKCIVANISNGKLWWASAAQRGKGVLRLLWYTLAGNSLGTPTHYIELPAQEPRT